MYWPGSNGAGSPSSFTQNEASSDVWSTRRTSVALYWGASSAMTRESSTWWVMVERLSWLRPAAGTRRLHAECSPRRSARRGLARPERMRARTQVVGARPSGGRDISRAAAMCRLDHPAFGISAGLLLCAGSQRLAVRRATPAGPHEHGGRQLEASAARSKTWNSSARSARPISRTEDRAGAGEAGTRSGRGRHRSRRGRHPPGSAPGRSGPRERADGPGPVRRRCRYNHPDAIGPIAGRPHAPPPTQRENRTPCPTPLRPRAPTRPRSATSTPGATAGPKATGP